MARAHGSAFEQIGHQRDVVGDTERQRPFIE
jgi:hypothetical protein